MRPKRLDTPEEIERRRAIDRLRVQRKRAAETPEQTAIRLEKQRLRNHRNYRIRCSETPEEIARRAAVRAQQALRIELGLAVVEEEQDAEQRILEEYRRPTPLTAAEKAARRKEADRLRHLKARQLETPEDAQRRREAAHLRYQKARELQTDEEKERRREADRQRKQDARIQLKERRRQAKVERQRKSEEEAERRRESARIRYQKTRQRKAASCKDNEHLQAEADCTSNQEAPEVEIVEMRLRRRQATHLKAKMARELETDEEKESRREADRIRDQKARQRARKQLKPVKKKRYQKEAWINGQHHVEAQPECRLQSHQICRQESQELEQSVQEAGCCPSVDLLCSTLLVRQFETVEKIKLHQKLDAQTAQLETVGPKCRRESDRVRHQNARQLETFEAAERQREADRIRKLKARQLAALVEAEVAEGQREEHATVVEQAEDTQSGDVDLEEGRAFHDALKRVIVKTNNNLAQDEADGDVLRARAAAARLKPDLASDGFHEESVVSTNLSADGAEDPKIHKFGSYVGQLASLVPTELRDSCMTAVTDVLYSFMASRVPFVVNPSTPEVQLMNKCRQDAIFKETSSITPDS